MLNVLFLKIVLCYALPRLSALLLFAVHLTLL